ncbi:MAG: hypothetical protein RJA44_473 [Pseudomonadota bacterium]
MNSLSRNNLYDQLVASLGIEFEEQIQGGANYEVTIEHEGQVHVSGMIPRVRGVVVVTGRVGQDVSLQDAQFAAGICVLRAVAALRQTLGDLNRVRRILKMNVYVQSAPDFTQQSEVANGASDMLYSIFFPIGGHTRTSIGVVQLPKNASVELDLLVAVEPPFDQMPGLD